MTSQERNISTINYIHMKETQADKTPEAKKTQMQETQASKY
jgi:hypothetical protein